MKHLLSVATLFVCFHSAVGQSQDDLLTVAERSDYLATSRYQDVIAFCETLASRSDRVNLISFGATHEARELPLLILSKDPLPEERPWEHAKLPAILCIGNIHAGEVCGKEALLMLARDLASQSQLPLLDHFILLIAPIYNADGNEQISKSNRPGQIGPAKGMGERANRMGLDLNRDYIKLEAPESRSLVQLLNRWDPSVVIDTHTTNGSHHRYALTYGGPRHPATDPAIADFVRQELLPNVSSRVRNDSGYETFFYGNFDEPHRRWTTYPALPRYGAHYVGLRNRISILSEAYSYASYQDRVLATKSFVSECLDEVVGKRDQISELIADADQRTKDGLSELAVRHRLGPFAETVTVKGFEEPVQDKRSLAAETPKDYEVEYWAKSESEKDITLPTAYVFSSELTECVERLQRHGVIVEQLRETIDLNVEVSRIEEVIREPKPFEGHRLVTLSVERVRERRAFPHGTIVVRTNQPLARLAAILLEPESEDGLAAWNFFDGRIEAAGEFPVFGVPQGQTLLTAPIRALNENRRLGRRVTVDTLYGDASERVAFRPPSTAIEWMPDGEHFLQLREGRLHQVDARSGSSIGYPNPENIAQSLDSIPSADQGQRKTIIDLACRRWHDTRSTTFIWNEQKTSAVITFGDDLYHLPMDGSPALRLTRTRGEEELAQYSPNGEFVAYVRGGNLFVSDLATQTEQAITQDASNAILNGKASWVYFEEVYGRDWRAFWWSPDSRHLAFCRFDENGMPTFHALDTIPRHGELKRMAHPKPGDPNPAITLGVAAVSGADVQWVDLSNYTTGGFLITEVGWQPTGSSLYFYVQDRAQTWLDFRVWKIGSETSTRLFRETTDAWVDNRGPSWWVGDEVFFLSDRSGWKHLYAFHTKTHQWRSITSGQWEIREINRVDGDAGWIHFTAREQSAIAVNWLRVRLDGSERQRLTQREGTHTLNLAPKGSLAVDDWSRFESFGDLQLIDTQGNVIRMLDSRPSHVLDEFHLGEFRHFQIPTEDGFQLEATLTLPPDFDASKTYPVWLRTYGGPHAPNIRDEKGPKMEDHVLANLGCIVFRMDPRCASGKGAQSTWTAYRRLGAQELDDIKTAVAWISAQPYVDANRIGMGGHSYGGYITAYAMTHSKLFAAGISSAPVTDWRNYDSIYTERYMNTPQENPQGYVDSSVVEAADQLHGRLLLIHGLMDDNVHPQNTDQFIQALQRAGKGLDDLRVMIYPQRKHNLRSDHYNRLKFDFIRTSLDLQ